MDPILKLIDSTNPEDRYLGRIALIRRNEELFLKHVRYELPFYMLGSNVVSAIIGDVYNFNLYFPESMIQELFPDRIKEIGGYIEYRNNFVLQEYFDWEPTKINKNGESTI